MKEMNEPTYKSIKDVPESTWKKLSEKKIYFGHQSVGNNILDGIKDVMKDNPKIKLNIVETNDPADFNVGVFAHSSVGKNHKPDTKNDDFTKFIKKGLGEKVDIAFFKYCFVDAYAHTDVEKVFNDYKETMARLNKEYPDITFVHMTMPLMTVQTGIRVMIKNIIGRPIGGYNDNIKRNQLNEMTIKEYEGKEPIFDLAKTESTLKDGTMTTFASNGKNYYSLAPDYTYDSGHLNETGRKIVAEQLLVLLANLSK